MNFNIILHQRKKIPVLAMFYFVTALFTWGIGMISPYISGLYINSLIIAIFKIKADIRMNKTTLNSQKTKHFERYVESRLEEHPVSLL